MVFSRENRTLFELKEKKREKHMKNRIRARRLRNTRDASVSDRSIASRKRRRRRRGIPKVGNNVCVFIFLLARRLPNGRIGVRRRCTMPSPQTNHAMKTKEAKNAHQLLAASRCVRRRRCRADGQRTAGAGRAGSRNCTNRLGSKGPKVVEDGVCPVSGGCCGGGKLRPVCRC